MEIRGYLESDAARAVGFHAACADLDPMVQPVTEEGWRGFVGGSYNLGGRDFAFALDENDDAIGLLTSYPLDDEQSLRHFRIIVHPHHRRSGVATRLLRWMEGRDEGRGTDTALVDQCNCMGKWEAGQAFLARHGFQVEARSLDMVREGPIHELPGVELRPYDGSARDDASWIALSEEGYRGTPGYTPMTPDDLANYRADSAFHLWFAERDEEIVGLCHTVLWQANRPFINSVVVTRVAQGQGLGRALTIAGLRSLAEAGHTRVELNVRADNKPARRIYDSLGFETAAEVLTYRRRRPACGSGAALQ